MSYTRGKITAQDLRKFKDFPASAPTAPAPPLPSTSLAPPAAAPVPAEKRSVEFKLAKLEKKSHKAAARGESAKVSMYAKEASRLRLQLAQLNNTPTVQPPQESTQASALAPRNSATSFGSKLSVFKDMLSRPMSVTQLSDAGSGKTEHGGIPEPSICGVGLRVAQQRNKHVVVAILPGSSSDLSSIRVGDVLVSIDDVPVAGESLQSLSSLLSGPMGTCVSVQTSRKGSRREPVRLERRAVASLLKTLASDLHPQTWQRETLQEPNQPSPNSSPTTAAQQHSFPSLPAAPSSRWQSDVAVGGVGKGGVVDLPHLNEMTVQGDERDLEWGHRGEGGGGLYSASHALSAYSDDDGVVMVKKESGGEGWGDGWGGAWAMVPERRTSAYQEALALSLLASINTARQHGTLGLVPSGLGKKADANAAAKMGNLLKAKERGKVDLSRLYTGDDLNQLENLPAKTAKQVALERIRAALLEMDHKHLRRGRPVATKDVWSLDSDADSDSELMNSSGEGSRAGGRGRNAQQPHEPWCVQICCRSLVSDSALCYQDLMTSVRCRAPPTMRCAGVGCCVLYCGLIAAALMALATMNPV
jgi:hypothetical protein